MESAKATERHVNNPAPSRAGLEKERAIHLSDIAAHEQSTVLLEEKLAKVKVQRESKAHFLKTVGGDADALRLDKKLADDEAGYVRELRIRAQLIQDALRAVADLDARMVDAHLAQTVSLAIEQSVAFENSLLAFGPVLEEIRDEFSKFEIGRASLERAIREFPDWAQNWLGKYFFQNFAERFRAALLTEVNRIIGGKKNPGEPDFFAANEALFAGVLRALETISTTAAGGAPGRTFYRVCNGSIAGVSGGLNLAHGDVISLPDDAETRRLIGLGALENVEVQK